MLSGYSSINLPDYKEYAIWLVTLIVVAFGFRYAKEIISFVLDKLYVFFIQDYHR